MRDYREMLGLDERDLERVDPLVRNLLVARSIPALRDLDISKYQRQADEWADDIRNHLPAAEQHFYTAPEGWRNDVNFFRLGAVCWFVEHKLGIAYKEDQRNVTSIRYTDPADLFLNGVMDTRRGTCGNMAALHVALAWRLGWPVSLACAGTHFLCRYDDGRVTHNIEATQTGHGGFKSDSDEYLLNRFRLQPLAVECGSDLRAVSPREMVGLFLGLRARHMRDTGRWQEAASDCLLARWLFPNNRWLYIESMALAVDQGNEMFVNGEVGSPRSLFDMLQQRYGVSWGTAYQEPFAKAVSLYGSQVVVHNPRANAGDQR